MRRKVTQQPDRVPPLLANRMLVHPVREWIDKGSRIRQEETGTFEQCRIGAAMKCRSLATPSSFFGSLPV